MIRVLVDVSLTESTRGQLRSLPGVEIEQSDVIEEEPRTLPAETLRKAQVLFCSCPPTNFEDLQALQWIQLASVGYEQLLPLDLPGRGVRATNALGVFDVPIAEWCLAMMIILARDLRGMIRNQECGVWDRDRRFQAEIRGRTVGFWGYGGLARETARLAKSAGLHVHVLTHRGVGQRQNVYRLPGTGDPDGILPDRVFTPDERTEFLGGLDFLVLAMPLTPTTRGIVGPAELQALRPEAILLNPARGPLVQEEALLEALREHWIAGAALDTHFYYPLPPEHPLWLMPHVILTPHISGSSKGTFFQGRIGDVFLNNLQRFVAGQPLLNEIEPEQLAKGGT